MAVGLDEAVTGKVLAAGEDAPDDDAPMPAASHDLTDDDEVIDEDEDIRPEPEETPVAPSAPQRRTARRPRAAAADVDASELPRAFADPGVGERPLQAPARYGFRVQNVGEGATTDPITLVDDLPAALA